MPNHVENILNLEGPEDQIRELLETVKYDEHGIGSLDFQKVIPMPKSLEIESGSRTTHGLKAYEDFWEVYTMAGTVAKDPLNVPEEREAAFLRTRTDIRADEWELGRAAFQNRMQYGDPTWYEWCVHNWGTKWNAYRYEGGVVTNDEKSLVFQTAWDPPHPVIEKLAEMFPAVRIAHEWADEDIGHNCGRAEYENGMQVSLTYPETESEAISFACSVWNYDEEEYLAELMGQEEYCVENSQTAISEKSTLAEMVAKVIVSMREGHMGDKITEMCRRVNEAKDMEEAFTVLRDYVSIEKKESQQMGEQKM